MMEKNWVRKALPLAGALVIFLAVGQLDAAGSESKPSAVAVEEARTRFLRGVQLYREGDHVAAMVEFKRAYRIAPNYRVLYNLALTSLKLQEYAAALDYFERYLAEGAGEVDRARRQEVKDQIQRLQARVGTLAIEVSVPGATVSVDDVEIGTSPIEDPVRVSAGRRKLTASLTGYVPVSRYVEVAGGDERVVRLEPTRLTPVDKTSPNPPQPASVPESPTAAEPEPTETPTPPEHDSARHGRSSVVWVGVGLTAALGAGAGTAGALALAARSDLDSELEKFPGDPEAIEEAQDRVNQRALLADVLTGATAAVGVATLVVALTSRRKRNARSSSSKYRDVELRIAPGHLTVGGRF